MGAIPQDKDWHKLGVASCTMTQKAHHRGNCSSSLARLKISQTFGFIQSISLGKWRSPSQSSLHYVL